MSIESFNRAHQILTSLQSCEDFEHFKQDSRGIRIQTDSLVEGIARLAAINPSDVQAPLILMGALIKVVSEDYGIYVRVKGDSNGINIHLRGLTGPMDESSTREELMLVTMRRSGVLLDVAPSGISRIYTRSAFIKTEDDSTEVSNAINELLKRLPEQRRSELADILIELVAKEVAISGEFLGF